MRAFLSHSSADTPLATKMYQWLRDQASSVWFDRVELRPGDPLEARISSGISAGDVFIVLVTDRSNASDWVQFETNKALELEKERGHPRVIPMRVKGAEVPPALANADKVYITIDPEQPEFDELIAAIFRDSHILDIVLDVKTLALNTPDLQAALHEYLRSDFMTTQARIKNHQFNVKVTQIAERSIATLAALVVPERVPQDIRSAAIAQIKRRADLFPICLPIYWSTLADLIGQLATQVFGHYGKNLEGLETAMEAINTMWQYAHFQFAIYLRKAIAFQLAEEFGFPDVAHYMRHYDGYDEEHLLQELFGTPKDMQLQQADLLGSAKGQVLDARVYLPWLSEDDRLMLQGICPVNHIVNTYTWYAGCLPQILTGVLFQVALHDVKPLRELEFKVGFKREDYDRIGLP